MINTRMLIKSSYDDLLIEIPYFPFQEVLHLMGLLSSNVDNYKSPIIHGESF